MSASAPATIPDPTTRDLADSGVSQNVLLDGKYLLLEQIGSTDISSVYAAEHVHVGKRVAVKVLLPALAEDAGVRMRFIAEAQAAARVGHANVVDISDVGIAKDGTTYVAMEFLEGRSLEAVLAQHGALPIAFACELMLGVLAGLSAAHAKGIVHGELQPSSIVITYPRPNRPLVKVMNFGIRRAIAESSGKGSQPPPGMRPYHAPERTLGLEVDGRADVFSAGLILYELLAGALPPDHGTSEIQPPLLTEVRADIPRALAESINRALIENTRDRTPSADEFADQIAPFVLHGAPPEPTIHAAPSLPSPALALAAEAAMSKGGHVLMAPFAAANTSSLEGELSGPLTSTDPVQSGSISVAFSSTPDTAGRAAHLPGDPLMRDVEIATRVDTSPSPREPSTARRPVAEASVMPADAVRVVAGGFMNETTLRSANGTFGGGPLGALTHSLLAKPNIPRAPSTPELDNESLPEELRRPASDSELWFKRAETLSPSTAPSSGRWISVVATAVGFAVGLGLAWATGVF
jgi:serine/threonine protein kinase